MAPTSDDVHELVAKLEARVKELEAKILKIEGGPPTAAKDGQSLRMILMGPPGAGMLCLIPSWLCISCLCQTDQHRRVQVRARKLQRLRRGSHAVIW